MGHGELNRAQTDIMPPTCVALLTKKLKVGPNYAEVQT